MDGSRIAVVTGKAMAALMPPLLDALHGATGAEFELIVAELVVRSNYHDRRPSGRRRHPPSARRPSRSYNGADSGGDSQRRSDFLDDIAFDDLRASLPIPVFPSYDFIDFFASEAEAVAA